jgi:AraC-like DNA-binding protein
MPKKKKLGDYPFIIALIANWKPRAKRLKVNLKDIAAEAKIPPQHLTRIITRTTTNPHPQKINDIEMALSARESEKKED